MILTPLGTRRQNDDRDLPHDGPHGGDPMTPGSQNFTDQEIEDGDTSSSEMNVFATGDNRRTSTRTKRSKGGSSMAAAATTTKKAAAAASKGKARASPAKPKAPPKTPLRKGKAGRAVKSASAGDLSTPDKSSNRRGKSKAQVEQENMFSFMAQRKTTADGKLVTPACFLEDIRVADNVSHTAPKAISVNRPFVSSIMPPGTMP